ncbi:GNAT family N-acetyltransferase [Limosilactobacillus gastricus]|uniref:GNAT family N-acetyltransferase n=1 Tax=Limosilactobacillus gastricus TaxID=227942 RepID=UPI00030D9944|nr:GNAT family N-acetyltransferase [Limosilactobacillus gastricus]
MQIRHAQMADIPVLAALERHAFPKAEAATQAQLKARVAAFGNHFWLLVDDDDHLIAFVNGLVTNQANLIDEMYERVDWHQEAGAWQMIFSVVTDPDHRKQGYASQCLKAAIKDAQLKGRQGLVLTCKDPLIGFYERFGFVNEGFTGSTHGGVRWNQLRLRFEESQK